MAKKLPKEVINLVNEITNDDHESVKPGTKLSLGNLFLFYYPNPKYASKLDVFDQIPLIILLDIPSSKHILGINLHYFSWSQRLAFLKYLQSKRMRIKYSDIVKALKSAKVPVALANYAIRKYLINRIASNVKIFENPEDQYEIVKNILPIFKKKTMSQVYKDIDKKFKAHKKKAK